MERERIDNKVAERLEDSSIPFEFVNPEENLYFFEIPDGSRIVISYDKLIYEYSSEAVILIPENEDDIEYFVEDVKNYLLNRVINIQNLITSELKNHKIFKNPYDVFEDGNFDVNKVVHWELDPNDIILTLFTFSVLQKNIEIKNSYEFDDDLVIIINEIAEKYLAKHNDVFDRIIESVNDFVQPYRHKIETIDDKIKWRIEDGSHITLSTDNMILTYNGEYPTGIDNIDTFFALVRGSMKDKLMSIEDLITRYIRKYDLHPKITRVSESYTSLSSDGKVVWDFGDRGTLTLDMYQLSYNGEATFTTRVGYDLREIEDTVAKMFNSIILPNLDEMKLEAERILVESNRYSFVRIEKVKNRSGTFGFNVYVKKPKGRELKVHANNFDQLRTKLERFL